MLNTKQCICKYCKKNFSNKYTLKTHQNKNKACLLLRSPDKAVEILIFDCKMCGYLTNTKSNLTKHICRSEHIKIFDDLNKLKNTHLNLKLQYSSEIENLKLKHTFNTKNLKREHKEELKKSDDEIDRLLSLDMTNDLYVQETIENHKKETEIKISEIKSDFKQQIYKYQDQMFELASKPTQVVKNTNNTLQVHIDKLDIVAESEFKNHESQLILDHIENGIKGFAKFTIDHVLKNKLLTTDVPRRMIKWKNEEQNVITDPYGKTLAPMLFSAYFPRYACLHSELGDNITNNPLLTDEQKAADRVKYSEYLQGFKNIMRGEASGDNMRDVWAGEIAKSTALIK
jgi:hypothetical protein